MPDPASYSWAMTLQNAVPIGSGVTMPTPGMSEPTNYDTDHAEVVYGGEVLQPDEFTLDWADDFTSVFITNESDEEWPVQDTIALAVAGVPFDPSQLAEAFAQIEARLLAVETRSTSNEAMLADHEARIKTNEDELAQLNNTVAIPHVTSQYFDSVSLAAYAPENRVQMVATNFPTGWEIVFETNNNTPTPGYWTIDAGGSVGLLPEGVAAFVPGDVTVVEVRATNASGHGDGSLTMHLVA